MQINKLNFNGFIQVIYQSIAIGKANYLVLFLAAMVSYVVAKVLGLIPYVGPVLAGAFSIVWSVGIAGAIQTIFEDRKAPTIKQFFVPFLRIEILRRLGPAFLTTMFLILGLSLLIGVIGLLAYTLMTPEQMQDAILSLASLFSLVFVSSSILIAIPFMFVSLIPVLQPMPWKPAISFSVRGVTSNPVIFLIAVPAIGSFLLISLFTQFARSSGMELGDSPPSHKNAHELLKIVGIFISPFFLAMYFLLFKAVYRSESPDVKLADFVD